MCPCIRSQYILDVMIRTKAHGVILIALILVGPQAIPGEFFRIENLSGKLGFVAGLKNSLTIIHENRVPELPRYSESASLHWPAGTWSLCASGNSSNSSLTSRSASPFARMGRDFQSPWRQISWPLRC
jgi:hypothetical protein